MKLFQRYVSLVSNLFKPFFLLVANFYFKKDYPQVDLSSFSTIRLSRMCAVRGRFPDLDIPLLSDEELARLYTETNMLYAKDAGKAAWWVAKTSVKIPFKVVQRTVSGVAEGSAKFDRLAATLNPMTGSSGTKASASGAPTYSSISTTNQASSTSSSPSINADTPVRSTTPSPPIDWYGKAYAIQGAVMTKSDGSSYAYYKKCEACGYVDTTSHV